MVIGHPVPGGVWSHYRFIDADQHNITGRVREMDPDAAIAVNTENDELAIMRRVPELERITGSAWTVAKYLPFKGEPDGRILQVMRESDNRNTRSLRQYSRDLRDGYMRMMSRQRKDSLDVHMGYAEREVHRHSRQEIGIKPTISVPRSI